MNLPENLRERLASEYKFALQSMLDSEDALKKIYFMSVFYGEATRVMNMHWDDQLCLIHHITEHVTRQLDARARAFIGGDGNVPVSDEYFNAITDVLGQLTDYVDDDGDDDELLRIVTRLNELGWMLTGNGYYMHLRGGPKI